MTNMTQVKYSHSHNSGVVRQGLLIAGGFMVATALFLEKKELVKSWVWTCLHHPREPATPTSHPPHPESWEVDC